MRRISSRVFRVVVAGMAVALGPSVATLGAAAAQASAADEPPPGVAEQATVPGVIRSPEAMVLTVSSGSLVWPVTRIAVLQCSPAGGTHPRAKEACVALAAVGGDLGRLRGPANAACATLYAPMTVSSAGVWGSHRVSYVHTYPSECELRNALG